jgi:hypothetical protein
VLDYERELVQEEGERLDEKKKELERTIEDITIELGL